MIHAGSNDPLRIAPFLCTFRASLYITLGSSLRQDPTTLTSELILRSRLSVV